MGLQAVADLVHTVRRPETGRELTGPFPTIILVHGRGGDENVMQVFALSLPKDWLQVYPRGLFPDRDGGYSWHERAGEGWPSFEQFGPAVAALNEFAARLTDQYGADPARLYWAGFSQGAAAIFSLAASRPRSVRAIASLVGFVPEGLPAPAAATPSPLAGIPIFMANGTDDERVPIARARRDAERLRSLGARLDFRDYPTGHRINADGMSNLRGFWAALV